MEGARKSRGHAVSGPQGFKAASHGELRMSYEGQQTRISSSALPLPDFGSKDNSL